MIFRGREAPSHTHPAHPARPLPFSQPLYMGVNQTAFADKTIWNDVTILSFLTMNQSKNNYLFSDVIGTNQLIVQKCTSLTDLSQLIPGYVPTMHAM